MSSHLGLGDVYYRAEAGSAYWGTSCRFQIVDNWLVRLMIFCATQRPSPKPGEADRASEDSLHLDMQKLKEKRDLLDKEISQLISEGYSVAELEDHISQLHEYNDIKDVGQMLLGKLAVVRCVTTRDLYPEFGLDMSD
ncbi:PREDICTED: DNA repair protein SWI5 homolog [Miniopterus natalensis]|uniref:DNA repair protein SWI5 homolog n=1 Tax=Miniopterus natalensis TaxID=291302 RepID=UPI0007A6DB1F|nr:PREDICTED: DNA repair protein SWI5 homolog [Miniopterus natalensis]